jgi:hypothetical protein
MEIHRITSQKQPLEEFYTELAALSQVAYSKICFRMLELIQSLRTIKGPVVWAMTSHATLNLLPGDDFRLPTLVSINCIGEWFDLTYRMPLAQAPWPNAYVTGRALDVERAGEMIVYGLQEALKATDLDINHYLL